ncbi:MAG: c-type cytochrome [Rhodothermales bacterium]
MTRAGFSRTLKKRDVLCAGLIAVLLAGCAASRDAFDVSDTPISATTDATVIARGRYLAYGPAHCVSCHTPDGPSTSFEPEETPPLVGGYPFRFPGGLVHAPNLTPDTETGIGQRTDAELVRVLRYGIRADGRKAVPIMEYQNLSDEDLIALISFLRAQAPVHHPVPKRRLNLMGKIGMALLIHPRSPEGKPVVLSPEEAPTVERGAYLANSVANCASCHTRRSSLGKYKGPRFAGGWTMPLEEDPHHVLVTPNLTPDSTTGYMTSWSEDDFLARFRKGRLVKSSHMPWETYATMSDDDLRALYRYLRTLEPVRNETRPVLRER